MGHIVPILAKQFEGDPPLFGDNIWHGSERAPILRKFQTFEPLRIRFGIFN